MQRMAENVLLNRTQRSKPPQKVVKSKTLDMPSEPVTIEQITAAFRAIRFLTKEEQIEHRKIIADIRKREGQEGVSKFLRKAVGLD